jgi:hypothetical protein
MYSHLFFPIAPSWIRTTHQTVKKFEYYARDTACPYLLFPPSLFITFPLSGENFIVLIQTSVIKIL